MPQHEAERVDRRALAGTVAQLGAIPRARARGRWPARRRPARSRCGRGAQDSRELALVAEVDEVRPRLLEPGDGVRIRAGQGQQSAERGAGARSGVDGLRARERRAEQRLGLVPVAGELEHGPEVQGRVERLAAAEQEPQDGSGGSPRRWRTPRARHRPRAAGTRAAWRCRACTSSGTRAPRARLAPRARACARYAARRPRRCSRAATASVS